MPRSPLSSVAGTFAVTAALAAASPAAAELIITEIMHDPAGGNEHEYIEIYNAGDTTIDLTGYILGSGDYGMTELGGSLGPGETVVPVRIDGSRALANYTNAWGSDINFFETATSSWPVYTNAGDTVTLYDSFTDLSADAADFVATGIATYDRAIDVVPFSETGFPASNDSASIYLVDLSADNSIGSNWALSTVGVDGAVQASSPRASDVGSPGFVVVPEPASMAGAAFLGLLLRRRR